MSKKIAWTEKDKEQAKKMDFELRPWRYELSDGCWTICPLGSIFPGVSEEGHKIIEKVVLLANQNTTCRRASILASGGDREI